MVRRGWGAPLSIATVTLLLLLTRYPDAGGSGQGRPPRSGIGRSSEIQAPMMFVHREDIIVIHEAGDIPSGGEAAAAVSPGIASFADCVAAGNPIRKSLPAICIDPVSGTRFVESLPVPSALAPATGGRGKRKGDPAWELGTRVTPFTKLVVPGFFYGTAWKKDRTTALTFQAIQAGFRALDTANQQKHYSEALVGVALARAYSELQLERSQFWLQTKYSHGQWKGSKLGFAEQVQQSVAQSLEHLQTTYLDSLLLHGPLDKRSQTLPGGDWESWREMEKLHDRKVVKSLGISNVNPPQLRELLATARIKPDMVQIRTFAAPKANEMGLWREDIRSICRKHGIIFEAFSLLTANKRVVQNAAVGKVAAAHSVTRQQAVFRFAMDVGMVPITGSSSAEHLRQDLDVFKFKLHAAEVGHIEQATHG